MSFIANLHNSRTRHTDPLGYQMDQWLGIAPKTPPPPPSAPTQDTAANAALQQGDQFARRRGVLSNIFGGGSSNPSPSVGSKTLLGT